MEHRSELDIELVVTNKGLLSIFFLFAFFVYLSKPQTALNWEALCALSGSSEGERIILLLSTGTLFHILEYQRVYLVFQVHSELAFG